MKLNNLDVKHYDFFNPQKINFVLDCTFEEASALDSQKLVLTDDENEVITTFGSYTLCTIEKVNTGRDKRCTFIKALEPNTAQAISSLEDNSVSTQKTLLQIKDDLTQNSDQIDLLGNALEELIITTLGRE